MAQLPDNLHWIKSSTTFIYVVCASVMIYAVLQKFQLDWPTVSSHGQGGTVIYRASHKHPAAGFHGHTEHGHANAFGIDKFARYSRQKLEFSPGESPSHEYVADWQTILENVLYAYSAHLDARGRTALVRVFCSMHERHLQDPVACVLWTGGVMTSKVKAEVSRQSTSPAMFAAVTAECLFPGDPWSMSENSSVSLHLGENRTSPRLRVEQGYRTREDRNFTVCLWTPLYTGDAAWFVEWVEMNLILGAELIYIYDFYVQENVRPYLEHYARTGVVRILPWHEPRPGIHRSHLARQHTMIGDCQQRNINKSRYVVGADLDELILPRGPANSWQQLVEVSGCHNASAFIFRQLLYTARNDSHVDPLCAQARPCFDQCDFPRAGRLFLRTMCTSERMLRVARFYSRTKYIASPVLWERFAVHTPGSGKWNVACKVNVTVGALHHYRKGRIAGISFTNESIYDNSIHRFWHRLASRMRHIRDLGIDGP